jgi:hypothetical protein
VDFIYGLSEKGVLGRKQGRSKPFGAIALDCQRGQKNSLRDGASNALGRQPSVFPVKARTGILLWGCGHQMPPPGRATESLTRDPRRPARTLLF